MMLSFITRGDYRVMLRANNWSAPKWIRFWAMAATRAGDGWLWSFIGLGILLFGETDRFAALGAAGFAAVLSIVSFMFLKRLTGRRRPCTIEPHVWATLLPPDQFSFPSGHTMTAFSVVTAISLFYPALSPELAFCALSIGTSRVLLGMHFLSDVLAAALIGALLGYGSYLAFS
jgi:undecaprenyl-diphosphatase